MLDARALRRSARTVVTADRARQPEAATITSACWTESAAVQHLLRDVIAFPNPFDRRERVFLLSARRWARRRHAAACSPSPGGLIYQRGARTARPAIISGQWNGLDAEQRRSRERRLPLQDDRDRRLPPPIAYRPPGQKLRKPRHAEPTTPQPPGEIGNRNRTSEARRRPGGGGLPGGRRRSRCCRRRVLGRPSRAMNAEFARSAPTPGPASRITRRAACHHPRQRAAGRPTLGLSLPAAAGARHRDRRGPAPLRRP